MNTTSESKPVRLLYAVAAGAASATTVLAAIPEVPRWIVIVVAGTGAVLTAALGRYTESVVTPTENVAARQQPDGVVVAGPASLVKTGDPVTVVPEAPGDFLS
jgi:hypothetical protein